MPQAQTAGPIPEAPADEEVEGRTDLLERLEQPCALNEYGMVELHPDVITEIVAALRRSTESDKPGRREAVLETVRAHKHTCANVQPGSTHADKCDCGALDTAGQVIPRSTTGGAK